MSKNTKKKVETIIEEDTKNAEIKNEAFDNKTIIVDDLTTEIKSFIKSVEGQNRLSHDQSVVLFDLYNRYTGRKETNYNCDVCAIRIFNVLRGVV